MAKGDGAFALPPELTVLGRVAPACMALLAGLLHADNDERTTAEDALRSPWWGRLPSEGELAGDRITSTSDAVAPEAEFEVEGSRSPLGAASDDDAAAAPVPVPVHVAPAAPASQLPPTREPSARPA